MNTKKVTSQMPSEKWPLPWLRSIGFRYLIIADGLALFTLMIFITTLRFGTNWPSYSTTYHLISFGIATLIHLTIFYFGGLYEYEQRLGRPAWLPRVSSLSFIVFLTISFLGLFTSKFLVPRATLVFLFLCASIAVAFNRWLSCSVRSKRFGKPRILLIGDKSNVDLAISHLEDSGGEIEIVGSVAPGGELLSEIDSAKATDVLLLSGQTLVEIYPHPLNELEQRKIGIYKQITPSDTLLGLQKSRQIAGMPFVSLLAHVVPQSKLRLKRLLDLIYLLILSPVILALFFLVFIYMCSKTRSHIFFKQERVGHLGQTFFMWKFRTMRKDAEFKAGAQLASHDDPRILNGMKWIRKTRLDELPQLLNVLKGDMSLVGPRPERPEFVRLFEERIPGYERRHDMPPGLTGLAQVQGHYQTDPSYKLGHDLQYIVNWSPILDLQIGLRTLVVVIHQSSR